MSRVTALLAIAALLAGCSKTASTDSGQPAAGATDSTSAGEAASPGPAVTGAGTAGASSELPVYPRATKAAGRSATLRDGAKSTEVVYYVTSDDGPTVAAWYAAHLPPDWDRDMGAPGKKITGVFSSPDESQMMMVTGDSSGTEIQVSTEVTSR